MADFGRYPYDEGDLLEQRNSYFYSPYQGVPFLEAWAARRDECACASVQIDETPSDTQALTGQTDLWLEELRVAFADGQAGADEYRLLDRLIQRFEVSKRLHSHYTPEFKPVDRDDFRHPARYVAFAEVLVAAYRVAQSPQVLNALLKVMDTICALRRDLAATSAAKLAALVAAERSFVTALAGKLKTSWPSH